MVKVKFIVPETGNSMSISELGLRKSGAFGKADTFVSHCWVRILSHLFFIKDDTIKCIQGAKWGLMVAALAEHANLKRRVWIDVFTVRQWRK